MTLPGSGRRPIARPGPAAARWLLGLLLLALLHAQGLGQWHRVAHAGVQHGAAASMAAVAHAGPDLFGHGADDERSCRLFDQLGGADGLPSMPLVCTPQAMPQAAPAAVVAQSQGRPQRPYEARAPPRG